METVTGFISVGSKITADGDRSHEIKRGLLLGRKAMPNLDSLLKSTEMTLLQQSVWSKEIYSEYLLQGLMLKLKLQYFRHLMWKADSLEKTLMLERLKAGGEGDNRRWDGWMASPTQWTWVWVNFGRQWRTVKPGVLESMGSQRVRHDWATELNWTERLNWTELSLWKCC